MGDYIDPKMELFFLLNDPNYKRGYENGFRVANDEIISCLEELLSVLKKSKPFTESTSTTSTEKA